MVVPLIPAIAGTVARTAAPKVAQTVGAGATARVRQKSFLEYYGKALKEKTRFDPKGLKKYVSKVKSNPHEALRNFITDYKMDKSFGDNIKEIGQNVLFDIPEGENSPFFTGEEKKKTIKTPSKFFDNVGNLGSSIRDAKIVGSIPLLLLVILFIVFAIRPVNNSKETRLTLMFKAILGLTEMTDETEDDLPDEQKEGINDIRNIEGWAKKMTKNLVPQYSIPANQLINIGGNFTEKIYKDMTDNSPVNMDGLYNVGGRG